jgi:hypothetical protein
LIEARKQAKLAEQQRILAEQQRMVEEETARKQALVDERNALAGTIMNSAITITMLEERFELTEVIGYQMQAEQQKEALFSLLRRDHAMLTPGLWQEVDAAYQRDLPGLTLWRASYARKILSQCRGY